MTPPDDGVRAVEALLFAAAEPLDEPPGMRPGALTLTGVP